MKATKKETLRQSGICWSKNTTPKNITAVGVIKVI